MKNYICKYGLFHDKPVKEDNEPSSNNGWIYTAYAKHMHEWDDSFALNNYYELYTQCFTPTRDTIYPFTIQRLPELLFPPISRDEVIGMASLGLPIAYHLYVSGWLVYDSKKLPKYSILSTIKGMIELGKKENGERRHRNYVWQKPVLSAYSIAFRIWHHDRYYIKKMSQLPTTWFESFAFHLSAILTICGDNTSVKNLYWLMLTDLDSKILVRFIKQKENFLKYFGKEHAFNNL